MNNEPYKWSAEEYLKASSEQQKWAAELIKKLDLKGDETGFRHRLRRWSHYRRNLAPIAGGLLGGR